MSFNENLTDVCLRKNSHVCIGLDIDIEKVPPFIRTENNPLVAFGKAIIGATAQYAAAYKINTAFFEAYGIEGWKALGELAELIPKDTIAIADAKRGDIGNTSRMYAKAFLEELDFDSVTVNPYLGYDSVSPFIENENKGVFILCMTSNKGATDFQYITENGQTLYLRVAEKVKQWNEKRNCGLVVGATHPDELKNVRSVAPGLPFLIPGIGAQGGDLERSAKYALAATGDSAIFNSSRGIIYASQGQDFAEVAAEKTLKLKETINAIKE